MRGTGLLLPRTTIGVSRWRRFRAAVDWPLIVVIVALCTLGLLNLYSATRGVRHHAKFDTQVQWMVVGAIGFAVATIVDYRTMVRHAARRPTRARSQHRSRRSTRESLHAGL